MNRYQHTYRISSSRMQNWDYRWDAAYFITICTQNQEHFFGEIENDKMHLSGVGILADVFWHEIPNHSPNVELGQFVVMPNHIHGILVLNGNTSNPADQNVETLHATSLHPDHAFYSGISPKSNSVSVLIRSYKSAVTKHNNRLGLCPKFRWQARFHDHIIRDEIEFQKIKRYIQTNPENWKNDKFFNNSNI
ncbi:MAG TPA: transposase [Prolixibacteraceae bacterium]|nr:transposase [Prolixibacteraceae bacterium]